MRLNVYGLQVLSYEDFLRKHARCTSYHFECYILSYGYHTIILTHEIHSAILKVFFQSDGKL